MPSQNLTGMKKLWRDQRGFIAIVLGAFALVWVEGWALVQLPIEKEMRVISIESWIMHFIAAGLLSGFTWWVFRTTRQFYKDPTEEDPDGSKRQKRLRQRERFDRWAPYAIAALIVIFAALLVLSVSQEAASIAGTYGAIIAIPWILGKPFLKADRIEDPAKRQAARAQVLWRLANQCPFWLAGAIALHLALLSVPAYFGASLPAFMAVGFPFQFLFMISWLLGSWMLGAGLAGQPATARSQQSEESSATPPQPTRWRRSPKLLSIGAVTVALALASEFAPFMEAMDIATVSVSTTRGLIAFLRGNDDYDDVFDIADRIAWPELESRMPLNAENRNRLVEEFLFRAGGEYGTFSMMTPGMGDWLGKELGHGPDAHDHLDRALEIVENTNIPKDTVYHISKLLEALYATPASALTPEQFDTLANFTLTTLASKKDHDSLVTYGGCTWLTEQSKAGRLSPEQEERFRAHAGSNAATTG